KSGVYDYRAKYQSGQSEYHFPARLSPTRYKGVLNIAERAAACLGVTGAARVDMLVTEGENEYVLEVNTLPGMTPTSLLPKIAAGAGYLFEDLCEAILERATLGASEAAAAERISALPVGPRVPLARWALRPLGLRGAGSRPSAPSGRALCGEMVAGARSRAPERAAMVADAHPRALLRAATMQDAHPCALLRAETVQDAHPCALLRAGTMQDTHPH